MADGVIVVDKPRGPTSHDVVAKARRALGTREIGHAGTLDPMATGVLVLAVGEATKLVPYLTAADKEYEATVTLGIATDTLDAEGRETERAEIPSTWQGALPNALDAEANRTSQRPPAFSAIHTKGERAHEIARRGETVELAEREVRVVSLASTEVREREVRLRLVVSKGYYVRSLARDLALRLGTVGHLSALRRVRSGVFSVSDAIALDTLDRSSPRVSLADAAIRVLPSATLDEAGVAHARAGRAVPLTCFSPHTESASEHAWLAPDGALVAIGRIALGVGRVTRGFR